MKTHFPDLTDLLNFTLTITPDEGESNDDPIYVSTRSNVSLAGMYKGGAFNFSFAINANYPHDPPKVKCTQTVSLSWPFEMLVIPVHLF